MLNCVENSKIVKFNNGKSMYTKIKSNKIEQPQITNSMAYMKNNTNHRNTLSKCSVNASLVPYSRFKKIVAHAITPISKPLNSVLMYITLWLNPKKSIFLFVRLKIDEDIFLVVRKKVFPNLL